MQIASWNVNSVKARLTGIVDWLKLAKPDIVCLQELKSMEKNFPYEAFEDLGYNCAVFGQKAWNGVAILSKFPIEDVQTGLPGDESDEQARYIEALITGPGGTVARIASIYLPNGNPVDTDKYPYKLRWMARLERHARRLLTLEEPLILAGDYNVIPAAVDVYAPENWQDDALFRPQTRMAFNRLLNIGLSDGFRLVNDKSGQYSFWDYKAGAWQKDHGLRIDHLLLSPEAADRLDSCWIDRRPRGAPKPSDHTPVVGAFRL